MTNYAASLPFSGIDLLYSAGVGVLLLVGAVAARLRISRAGPSIFALPQRVTPAAERITPDQPQVPAARAQLPA